MGIGEDIKQKSFKSEFSKAIINVFFTSSWLGQKHHEFFRAHQLTSAQFNVLRILRGQYPQPATVNLIIERMLDKSSNASRIVDKLESKQLVRRNQCPHDRRAVDVVITDEGLKLLEQMDIEIAQLEQRIQKLTDKEAEQLNVLLDKMRS
jgi:DNA-binding MarR family transcriptional regulator